MKLNLAGETLNSAKHPPLDPWLLPQMDPWSYREATLPCPRPSTGLLSWGSRFVLSLQTTEAPSLSSTSAADLAYHLAEKTETVWREHPQTPTSVSATTHIYGHISPLSCD